MSDLNLKPEDLDGEGLDAIATKLSDDKESAQQAAQEERAKAEQASDTPEPEVFGPDDDIPFNDHALSAGQELAEALCESVNAGVALLGIAPIPNVQQKMLGRKYDDLLKYFKTPDNVYVAALGAVGASAIVLGIPILKAKGVLNMMKAAKSEADSASE